MGARMKQVKAFEAQAFLDEYLIDIDREPVQVEVGIGCANAVIISQDEFERLKYAEHSLSVMGSIVKRMMGNHLQAIKTTNLRPSKRR